MEMKLVKGGKLVHVCLSNGWWFYSSTMVRGHCSLSTGILKPSSSNILDYLLLSAKLSFNSNSPNTKSLIVSYFFYCYQILFKGRKSMHVRIHHYLLVYFPKCWLQSQSQEQAKISHTGGTNSPPGAITWCPQDIQEQEAGIRMELGPELRHSDTECRLPVHVLAVKPDQWPLIFSLGLSQSRSSPVWLHRGTYIQKGDRGQTESTTS